MNKTILAIAAAATLAAGTLTAPTAANARCIGCWVGGAVLGGVIIGSAIANAQPRGGYVVYDGYDRPYPRRCPDGYWARRRLYDRSGEFVGWSKPHFVCPY